MKNIYQFDVKNLKSDSISLSSYKGKVLLIVNTATECGFTPQFKGLQALYQEYKEAGFEILAFPSNDFLSQEPRDGEAIGQFCEDLYQVSFPIFGKVHVKGPERHELFAFLANKEQNGRLHAPPRWNFHKYLINRQGELVNYFYTFTRPESRRLKKAIQRLL